MKRSLAINQSGFTSVELILACVIFPVIVIGMANAFAGLQRQYQVSRQFNEMYAVLSACPEIDRALEYSALTSTTNCSPNNVFAAEGGSGQTISYTPTVTVSDTTSLSGSDALSAIPDSKVVNVTVSFPRTTAPPLQLRMLVTRNGIGQL